MLTLQTELAHLGAAMPADVGARRVVTNAEQIDPAVLWAIVEVVIHQNSSGSASGGQHCLGRRHLVK